MSNLILNFALEKPTHNTNNLTIQTTPGSWTHKLKQKRKVKHIRHKLNQKSQQKPLLPQSNPEPQILKRQTEQPISQPHKKQKLLDTSKPVGRLQIISSLFSSTIIPTIKPTINDEQTSMVVYAPSNASLSEIQLTSPSLKLHAQISNHLSNSSKLGAIKSPTAIQSIAWPLLSTQSDTATRDVIVQSETGSGKTLAYLVPIIQDLLTAANSHPEITWSREIGTLAIILVPTRELAEQVYHVAIDLLSFPQRSGPISKDEKTEEPDQKSDQISVDGLSPRWLVPGTLHGGTNRTHEKARLRRGLPLLVCTPGRLLDHLEKTASLRMAGEPIPPSNDPNSKSKVDSHSIGHLNLRWLVVDEADRLMDMGFEEQMRGILKHLTDREAKTRNPNTSSSTPRRTVLCSATMPDGVKKLVGMSLNDPILLKAAGPNPELNQSQPNNSNSSGNPVNKSENSTFSAPTQLSQHYVLTPPKLRLVSLIALLRRITNSKQKKPAEKVLVFMSCTASVDFHFEAIGAATSAPDPKEKGSATKDDGETEHNKLVKQSKFLPGVKIFRLHGSLDLQTRLASLNAFSNSNTKSQGSSILFCTSLAGRGLDVPFVSHVIQYDLPTEGGVTEYLHRVGRTARAGQAGEAWSFLLPSEAGWVDWCEASQSEKSTATTPKLKEVGVQTLLNDGFGGKSQKDWEVRATDTQMTIERWVIGKEENQNLASMAFSSHIRAYATHPSQEKRFFHVKNLHLGHLAKAFGLREPPKKITGMYAHPSTDHQRGHRSAKNEPKTSKKVRPNLPRDSGSDQPDDNIDADDDEDMPSSFKALSQFKSPKNGNSLRGPIFNSIDEFNLG